VAHQWDDALDDIKDGNKLVGKGNKAMQKAHKEIREGGKLIASGDTIKRDLEQARLMRERDSAKGRIGNTSSDAKLTRMRKR
jgi:hypothetical protein